MVKRDAVLKM